MFVKEIQLFKNLDPGFINELADLVEEVSFPEKHVVVRQGEEATGSTFWWRDKSTCPSAEAVP